MMHTYHSHQKATVINIHNVSDVAGDVTHSEKGEKQMYTARTAYSQIGFGLALVVAGLWINQSTAWAQSTCEEPQDAEYLDRMAQAREALDIEDYETALEHFIWASERYDYAIMDYGIARGLHRLGRYSEAEAAYSRFLRRYEGCPDPDDLTATAQEYRSLAIREQSGSIDVAVEETPPVDEGGINPGWFVLGGGVALMGTGVIYDFANLHLRDDKQAADDADNDAEFNRIQEEIDDVRTVEWVLFGTGLAAITTGVVLLLIDDEEADSDTSVGWSPLRDGAVFTFSSAF